MTRNLKRFSICSAVLLGLLGAGVQVSTHDTLITNPIPVSASSTAHKGLSRTAHRIKRDVLHQEQQAIQNNQTHIQASMPQNLNSKQQKYYLRLVKQNDAILQKIRAFAQQRSQYHYPEIAVNTRDLGGYHTENGLVIKNDKLIRSNNLHHLTPQGDAYLKNNLHVNDVIDLRNTKQRDKAPDADEDTYTLFDDSVYSSKEAKKTNSDTYKYGSQYRYQNIYSTNKQARQAYSKALHQILNDKHGAVLYHCIEGRDRTGITSVLLLSSLHVPKNTIIKDYLLTNYYEPRALFTDQTHNINTFYRTINNKYGTVSNYLDSLGIGAKQRSTLQHRYLESEARYHHQRNKKSNTKPASQVKPQHKNKNGDKKSNKHININKKNSSKKGNKNNSINTNNNNSINDDVVNATVNTKNHNNDVVYKTIIVPKHTNPESITNKTINNKGVTISNINIPQHTIKNNSNNGTNKDVTFKTITVPTQETHQTAKELNNGVINETFSTKDSNPVVYKTITTKKPISQANLKKQVVVNINHQGQGKKNTKANLKHKLSSMFNTLVKNITKYSK